jgi:hypothetical protein
METEATSDLKDANASRVRLLAAGVVALVTGAVLVACSQSDGFPHIAGGLDSGMTESGRDGEGGSPSEPSCAHYGGACIPMGGECPFQITGIDLCGGGSSQICCTGQAADP